MSGMRDSIPPFREGNPVSAGSMEKLRNAATSEDLRANGYSDGTGRSLRRGLGDRTPRFATAIVNEASGVVPADTEFEVDGVVCIQPAGATLAETGTWENTYGFTLDDDAKVFAAYDEVNDEWICIQGECPA